jgi:hypothetical protein
MSKEILSRTALEIVNHLVRGEYDLTLSRVEASRLTAEDLREAIDDYGRKLITPPAGAYEDLDAVEIRNANAPIWSIRVPLWSEEEGRSDLTLELLIALRANGPTVTLDDLHVL